MTYPVIHTTKQQEDKLIKAILKGQDPKTSSQNKAKSLKAMAKLLEMLQPLVGEIAIRYSGSGKNLESLLRTGNLGIKRAINHYDPKRKYKFSTYTIWWIRSEIHKSLNLPI